MTQTALRRLALTVLGLTMAATPVLAGSSTTSHGVRVLKLMPPQETGSRSDDDQDDDTESVTPHRHKVILREGQRVIVRFQADADPAPYQEGVQRPWQDRRYGQKHRRYLNPKGLYSSQIYKRGNF